MRDDDPAYERWLAEVPATISADTLWRLPAYRLGLYLASEAVSDVEVLHGSPRLRAVADQLIRSVGSIPANIAEGYGRSTGRERARFYEFALGSAREARDWYFVARAAFPDDTLTRRLQTLERIRRILAAVIPRERDLPLRPARKLK
jgi:four helix bundle protein